MSLASQYKNPSAVIAFFETEDGKLIMDYFIATRNSNIKQLRKAKELKDIFYAQGAADAADAVVNIPQDIREYFQAIRDGKIKPKSEGGDK